MAPAFVQQSRAKAEAARNTQIFISYSRTDSAFADRLAEVLESRSFGVLIDRSDTYAFEEWWKRIETLITQADAVVFVMSPDALASSIA